MFTNRGFFLRDNRKPSMKSSSHASAPPVLPSINQFEISRNSDLLKGGFRGKITQNYRSSPLVRVDRSELLPHSARLPVHSPLNTSKTTSILKLFSNKGYGGFRSYIGSGFLISPTLMITSNMLIPNHHVAASSMIAFEDISKTYKLMPEIFFYTHESLKFSIIAVDPRVASEQREGVPLLKGFTLKNEDPVIYFNKSVETKFVRMIDEHSFCYAGNDLPAGLPIFDIHWKLQGMHISTSPYYKVCQATKIDSIFRLLETDLPSHGELTEMLNKSTAPKLPQTEVKMYWFEWYSRNVYVISGNDHWVKITPNNASELDSKGYWYFHWNCRYVQVSSKDILIAGGLVNKDTPSAEVYLYRILENTLHRVPSMSVPREAPGVVCVDMTVYVIGGRGTSSCECVNLQTYAWKNLSSMNSPRHAVSACSVLDRLIFVIGGMPETASNSFEKYSISDDKWEMVMLKEPFLHSAIVVSNNEQICVFGGKTNKVVWRFETDPRDSIFLNGYTNADFAFETIFPVALHGNQIYTLCGNEGYKDLHVNVFPLELVGKPQEQNSMNYSYSVGNLNKTEILPPIRERRML